MNPYDTGRLSDGDYAMVAMLRDQLAASQARERDARATLADYMEQLTRARAEHLAHTHDLAAQGVEYQSALTESRAKVEDLLRRLNTAVAAETQAHYDLRELALTVQSWTVALDEAPNGEAIIDLVFGSVIRRMVDALVRRGCGYPEQVPPADLPIAAEGGES